MKRKSSRGRTGQKRKVYWTGATLSINNADLANAGFGEVATSWAKWPSGLLNFGGTTNPANEGFPEPSDETLVKTIVSANITLRLQGALQGTFLATGCFGLIAWEASTNTAVDLDSVINASGTVPNPARDWGADWILRIPATFTRDNFAIGNIAETFIVSRAMRKLPPRTGLLACFGFEDIFATPEDVVNWDAQFDMRFLFKSGYYSI